MAGPEGAVEALYLHIPFCVSRCAYCGFYSQAARADDGRIAGYLEGLGRVLRLAAERGLLAHVRTAYIGGGTPTLAGEGLVRLAAAVRAACPELVEFTSEANPDSLDAGLAGALRHAGVTRVSLGVQSLDDAELRALGRAHTSRQALEAAARVKGAGLDLSCDLMCGVPGQTPASWEASLAGVVAAGADHVSCYPLAIEEGTPFDDAVLAGRMDVPDADLQADMMLRARDVLAQAGFERYEVASYARPGHACAHNVAYWTGQQYLGLGAGASSMLGVEVATALAGCIDVRVADEPDEATGPGAAVGSPGVPLADFAAAAASDARLRLTFAPDSAAFTAACGRGVPFTLQGEALSARQAASEDLMLAMRMVRGASRAELESFVGRGVPERALRGAVDEAVAQGLAELGEDGSLRPTQRGWLLGNELFGIMWDTASDA